MEYAENSFTQSQKNEAVHYLNKLNMLFATNPLVFVSNGISPNDISFISDFAKSFAATPADKILTTPQNQVAAKKIAKIAAEIQNSAEMERLRKSENSKYINIGMGITRPLFKIFSNLSFTTQQQPVFATA